MPPRSVLKPKEGRPVSAVFIGKGDAPNHGSKDVSQSPQLSTSRSPALPELPEPPSPSSSIGSVKSGLPSPPGTNSTGSGSTGDPATIAIRERPISLHSSSSTSTSSGSHTTPVRRDAPSSRSASRLADYTMDGSGTEGDFDDDYDKDNGHDNDSNLDGDDTARLDHKLLSAHSMDTLKSKSSSENRIALQRAKSLAQRNRLVIDKLSRLGSPSPARSGTPNSRSPVPSQAGSSRSQSMRPVRTSTQASQRHETIRSGSETERESTHQTNSTHSHSSHSASSHSDSISLLHSQYSDPQRSTTPPPSSGRSALSPNASPYNRPRHISAPESPHKARLIATSTSSDSNSNKSPSHRRRNRVSMASVHLTDFDEEGDAAGASGTKTATSPARERKDRILSEADMITQSALAAVASSRRSPVGQRRRSALPREFRSDLADGSPTSRVKKNAGRYNEERGTPEDQGKENAKMHLEPIQPFTPFRAPSSVGRPSTVRERRNPASPRWSSDDYRTPATLRTRPFNTSYSNEDGNPRRERRQSIRGGSVENVIWSPTGRSLLREGLRAAGITRGNEEQRKGKRVAVDIGANGDAFKERVRKVDWSPQDVMDDGSRRALVDRERERSMPQRASTSMAQYQYLDRDSPDVPRGHRTSYSLVLHERDSSSGERTMSAVGRHTPGNTPRLVSTHLQERINSASPFGSRRYGAALTPQTEHARLMLDSLTMFETSLAKIPRSGPFTSVGSLPSHADVSQNAQGMVFAADRLYNLLKQGSARAIEAQVEAEVESAAEDPQVKEIVDLWGKVASDYREGSRMADDLIRGITGVLLGIGRVMREFMVEKGVSEFGSPSLHGRHASLDDDLRRTSPEVSHLNNSGGRSENSSEMQSVSSRGSRDRPRGGEREREETVRRQGGAVRPESVLARASPATFQRLKNREHFDHETSPTVNGRYGGSVRRSSTLREQRVSTQDSSTLRGGPSLVPADSQETIQPSPTPAPRQKSSVGRPRALPPLSIPRPLPILPSETLLRRTTDESGGNELSTTARDRDRRRATIRGSERPVFASLTSPANPTTALTPHTVSNVERYPNLLQRTDSTKSGRSQVTFSRPTAVSVEKSLSELQQADGIRKRTISASSPRDGDNFNAPPRRTTAVSGSETERDVTRKTLGRARMSLDIQLEDDRPSLGAVADSRNATSHAADRSAATTILTSTAKRDRRRTVTDIWQR